ncbi:hypothetical protein HF520_06900 [Romboutsia sp. CE17]|uniref:hypothetical protein n=1 Tax=Romboutsia sp. CE17 TaxID=2724150 RepID=UPI001442C1E5|nr:hypothetical protein [Romboutsia sp. CE17]QJA08685.1 hypothetical protein HF520_06900 [Romboutsia sp. CE17]
MQEKITTGFLLFTGALGHMLGKVFTTLEKLCVQFLEYDGLTTEQKATMIVGVFCIGIILNYTKKSRVSS